MAHLFCVARPFSQDTVLEWVKIMIAPRPGSRVDGFGLYTGGSRFGASVCVKWPFMMGEGAQFPRNQTHVYKCGGDDGDFEHLKVPSMSTPSPPAMPPASFASACASIASDRFLWFL